MSLRYLPVVVCSEHDSPLDALLALHVAQDDAADAVAAALHACDGDFAPGFAVLAETDGGRPVAAPGGWRPAAHPLAASGRAGAWWRPR